METEEYQDLTSALVEVRGDSRAAASVLGSEAQRVKDWLRLAHGELRAKLVDGRLEQGEALGEAIGTVLRAQEQGSNDELAENRIHSEALRWLIAGVGEINNRDLRSGISQLERLTESVYCSESLQWVAWLWISRAAAEQGDLARALDAAKEALALSEQLDEHARSLSLGNGAEAHFLAGDHDTALEHLASATELFEARGDDRGLAQTWLARARIEADGERDDRALEAAKKALDVDPSNEEALIFMGSRALLAGDSMRARALLAPAAQQDAPSAEIVREMRLATLVDKGEINTDVLREYYRLRGRPPSEQTVGRLSDMVESYPNFMQLRELLAWNLTRMGRDEEASMHFDVLVSRATAPELQRSALLGLGCLANRRHVHRQPGRWLRSASSGSAIQEGGAAASDRPPQDEDVGGFDMGAEELDEAMDLLVEADLPFGPRQTVPADLWPEISVEALLEGDFATPSSKQKEPTLNARPAKEERRAAAERAPVGSSRVVFSGQLQILAVPDLLDFLKSSRRTGTLVLTSDAGIGAVHLRNGLITGAASPGGANLGQVLLEAGHVTSEQLAEAASAQSEQPNQLLGGVLVKKGLVEEAALRAALERQVVRAVVELVQWTSGDFAFEPDRQSSSEEILDEIDLELDTQAVLLEALRQVDEMAREA